MKPINWRLAVASAVLLLSLYVVVETLIDEKDSQSRILIFRLVRDDARKAYARSSVLLDNAKTEVADSDGV
jgi:hypothetical protein